MVKVTDGATGGTSAVLNILTVHGLSTATDCGEFLSRMAKYSGLMPGMIDQIEPERVVFDPAKVAEIVTDLWNPLMIHWKRRHPRGEGILAPAEPHCHGSLTYWFPDGAEMVPLLAKYLREEAVALRADVGCVEIRWPGQLGSGGGADRIFPQSMPSEKFDLVGGGSLATIHLNNYLDQLPWATVFGPPYVRMFGRERLLSAPAAVVEEIAPEMIYIQLTPTVEDVTKDLNAYFALRRRVKEHIGPDAFFDPAKGKGPYRVPKFDLEPWPQPRPLGSIGGTPIVGLISGHPIIDDGDKREILSDMDFGPEAFGPQGKRPKGAKPQYGKIAGQEIVAIESGHPVIKTNGGTEIRADIVLGWHLEPGE